MCKMKNSLNGISSRWDIREENTNEFEGKAIKTLQKKTHREKGIKKYYQPWDNFKEPNVHVNWVSKGGMEEIFEEIMAEKISN